MIPKKIWTYWHEDINKNELVKKCIENWNICNDYQIVVLNDNNINEYISRSQVIETFDRIQIKSDWIRTAIIYEHGGFWLDASIVLNNSLEEWINHNVDFFGFYTLNDSKQIENWMFGAPKNSILIKKWLDEYEKAIKMGDQLYCSYVKEKNLVKTNYTGMPYLFHQLSLLVVLESYKDAFPFSFEILQAKDNAYSWLGTGKTKNGYFDNSGDLYNLFIKEDTFNSPLYKITGHHRKSINKFLKL